MDWKTMRKSKILEPGNLYWLSIWVQSELKFDSKSTAWLNTLHIEEFSRSCLIIKLFVVATFPRRFKNWRCALFEFV